MAGCQNSEQMAVRARSARKPTIFVNRPNRKKNDDIEYVKCVSVCIADDYL